MRGVPTWPQMKGSKSITGHDGPCGASQVEVAGRVQHADVGCHPWRWLECSENQTPLGWGFVSPAPCSAEGAAALLVS